MKYQTFEMNVSDTAIPVIPFGDGKLRSIDVSNPPDANGIGVVISRVDSVNKILEDNSLIEDKLVKPYLMLYFQTPATIEAFIGILNDVRRDLIDKINQSKNEENK